MKMRVKVGDKWFAAEPGRPIMVELKNGDKENIVNMHPDAACYALFDDADKTTAEEKLAWMNEGK